MIIIYDWIFKFFTVDYAPPFLEIIVFAYIYSFCGGKREITLTKDLPSFWIYSPKKLSEILCVSESEVECCIENLEIAGCLNKITVKLKNKELKAYQTVIKGGQ